MTRALILGDVHLGKGINIGKPGIGSILNSRIVDQLNILEWVLENAVLLCVNNIFITGDIYEDPKPHPSLISLFIEWLKKCSDHNINVHIVTGNHDILRSGQFYMSALDVISAAEIPNIFVYKNISNFHLENVSFTLVPFRDRRSFNTDVNSEAIEKLKEKIPFYLSEIPGSSTKVMIGHLSIDGSIPIGDEIDDMTNELFCPLDMFNGYNYAWFGHVHKPQVLNRKPYISHIGSMDLSDFYESSHKKIMVFIDTESKDFFKEIVIPTRPLKHINISIPDNTKDTTKYVLEEIDKTIFNIENAIVRVNIIFDGQDLQPINRNVIENKLLQLGAFSIFRISEERKIVNIKKNSTISIDNTVNTSTAIKMYAKESVEEEYRNDFMALAFSLIDEYNSTIKD